MPAFDTPLSTPSQEVITAVFVDIYGAAGLWDTQPGRMRDLTARLEPLLRAGVAAHGGALVKVTNPTNYFLVFPGAVPALKCLGDVLPRARRELWSEALGSSGLRAALVTGPSVPINGDYFGPTINHCARLLEAVAPWQILLSASSRAEIGAAPPAPFQFADRGELALRDVATALHVHEARHPDLPAAPPPAPRLPAPPTTFIGREAECEAVTALLRIPRTRLITLLGVGGCGKTRLAVETLRRLAPGSVGDVAYLAFTGDLSRDVLLAQIAQAFGCPAETDGVTLPALVAFLRARSCLLVLDNCEQLQASRALPVELLRAAPTLRCLVTSRAVLRAPGEVVFPVPPLSVDAAVALLADRARQARTDFAIAPENEPSLRAICNHLNCLPLALELAAPLLRGLSPQQLLTRIYNRRFDLAHALRDMDLRHQSLRHCLGWSYEALPEAYRESFDRLAVFSGDFTVEAAFAVCFANTPADREDTGQAKIPRLFDAETSVRTGVGYETAAVGGTMTDGEGDWQTTAAVLRHLCDNSLLTARVAERGTRYRLLDLVRQFALLNLANRPDNALARMQEQHARCYLRLAQDARRANDGSEETFFRVCALELDNLRAGMTYARQSGDVALEAEYARCLTPYFQTRET